MSLSRMLIAGVVAATLLPTAAFPTPNPVGTASYTVTTSLSPYLSASPYSFPAVSVPRFDLAGSCLTSVCVRLEGQTVGFASFENYDPIPKRVNVTWSAKFNLLRPSLAPLLAVTPTALTSDSVTTYDGVLDYGGTSGMTHSGMAASDSDSTCLTSAADLALFSGPGSISLPCNAANISTQTGANSWSFGIQGAAIVKVTYTYTKCLSPVRPTTWGHLKSSYR